MTALVDSGSERTLAAPGLARAIGVEPDRAREIRIGIGGEWRRVRFADVTIRLYQDVLDDDSPLLTEWQAEVGFFSSWEPPWAVVLGQTGFFDKFTVTMHRGVPALAVEPWDAFDDRFGVEVADVDVRQPRFRH